jgi:uncharacterized membrane protein
MPDLPDDLEALRRQLQELTERVSRLEAARPAAAPAPVARPAAPAPAPAIAPVGPPVRPLAPPPPTLTQKPTVAPPKVAVSGGGGGSLESKIGSQWLNRLGVAALLTGVAYFLKLAFDNNWIGPSGRIAIGLLAGIGLVFWASRIHAKGHKYFSYSLTAVGIGAMYLSLWAAFQLYHLIPAPVAFIAMLMVTASAATLALRQDAEILAVVALVGGLTIPLLLSTGQDRPFVLFNYTAMLDIAAVVMVSLKPWRRLLAIGYVGTQVLYFGWLSQFYNEYTKVERPVALLYATVFFLIFATLPVINRIQPKFGEHTQWESSKTFILLALVSPIIYFCQLFYLYRTEQETALTWAAVALAAFYIWMSHRARNDEAAAADPSQLKQWLHLGIGITFLTIAIPLKMHSHWITIGWLIEAGILIYLGKKAASDFLGGAGICALALGVFRLIALDNFTIRHMFFNWRFFCYLLAVGILYAIARAVRALKNLVPYAVATVTLNLLALLAMNLEVRDAFARHSAEIAQTLGNSTDWHLLNLWENFAYSALWMAYGAVLIAVGFVRRSAVLRWQALILIGLTICKVFLYDLSELSGPQRVLSLIALGALLMGISFVYQKDWLKLSDKEQVGD